MQLKKRLIYSCAISAAALITSIFIPIIPCRTAPSVPPYIYKWGLCSLNPDKTPSLNSITEYLGYTTSLQETYLLTLIIAFGISIIFFHFTTKRKRKRRR